MKLYQQFMGHSIAWHIPQLRLQLLCLQLWSLVMLRRCVYRLVLHVVLTQMVVPTADTVCFSYLLETCLDVGRSVLFVGSTGVGKSVITGVALQALATAKPSNLHADTPTSRVAGRLITHTVMFSAQTSSSDVQFLIEGKLEKKRKKR